MKRPARVAAAVFAFGIVVSCGDQPTGVRRPSYLISDGAHMHGNPRFYFLPPLVPQPAFSGTSDGSLAPTVTVCEYADDACVRTIARFTTTSGTDSEVIRYDAGSEHFIVNWHTDRCEDGPCSLDPDRTYRLRILVGLAELGFADVDVVSSGAQLRNVQTSEYIGLVNGRTLPVRFRIERGAVAVLPDGGSANVGPAGGLIASADDAVALTIPEGALAEATPVTIAHSDSQPEGLQTIAPLMELGPDGTVFQQPVTLTMSYDPAALPEGASDSDLAVVTLRDGSWEVVPGSVVNSVDHTVSAPIEHFSYYIVALRPTDAQWGSQPTTLTIGQTTVAQGNVTYRSCSWFRCYSQPMVNWWTAWSMSSPTGISVSLIQLQARTDAQGNAYATFRGRSLGPTTVTMSVQVSGGRWQNSPPLTLTVIPSLEMLAAHGNMPGLFPDTLREIGVNQAFGLYLRLPAALTSPLPVTITHTNPAVLPSLSGSVTIPAGVTTAPAATVIGRAPGRDTVIVSAPNYGPDTMVVSVGTGRLRVSGWPASLQFGDSAPLRIEPLDPSGRYNDGGYGLSYDLAASGNLRFSDGRSPITRIAVPAATYSTPTFYVTATGPGAGTLVVSEPNSAPETLAVDVVGQPPSIAASPYSVTITVAQGSAAQATISITNAGGGTLSGLAVGPFSDYFVGTPYPWISASLSSTTAPATITITAAPPANQFAQPYQTRFGVTAPGASNSEFVFYSINVNVVPASPTAEIAAGGKSSCRRSLDGSVDCWGETSYGATDAPATTAFTSIGAGYFHYCGIRTDQSLGCWGYNSDLRATPPGGAFRQVSVGPESNCALRLDDTAACWGFSNDGRVSVPAGTYSQISVGWYHGCAIRKTDATVVCWGRNGAGEATAPAGTFRSVEAGTSTSCGIRTDLTLVCWGAISTAPSGAFLSLGHTTGGGHHCAIRLDRTLACWGQNDFGQATPPSGLFAQVSQGGWHSCGIRTDGTPVCWGSNATGALNIPQNRWSSAASMPTAVYGMGGMLNSRLYVAGGLIGTQVTDLVQVYSTGANAWFSAARLPAPRANGAGAVLNGRLYVVGGIDPANNAQATLFEYNPLTDSWRTLAPMPRARTYLTAAAAGGKLYVFGGATGLVVPFQQSAVSDVDIYDPATDTWSSGTPLSSRRYTMTAGTLNGLIYVVGGYGPTNGYQEPLGTVEAYDPVRDAWTTLPNTLTRRGESPGVVGMNGLLYVMGGFCFSCGAALNSMETFNPATGAWSSRAPMGQGRWGVVADALNGRIYVAGGSPDNGNSATSLLEIYQP